MGPSLKNGVIAHGQKCATEDQPVDLTGVVNAEKEISEGLQGDHKNQFKYNTAFEYVRAYKAGKLTPLDVAKRIIEVR